MLTIDNKVVENDNWGLYNSVIHNINGVKMSIRPGTVSKILWHFTGGPKWDVSLNKQLAQLKATKDAYESFLAILNTKELKVGSYKEIIKVVLDDYRYFDKKLKKIVRIKKHPITVKSNKVCCVADIPLQHLAYHSNRYGKIAIGFHRSSIIRGGFNPVMYTLENTKLLNSIYTGWNSLDKISSSDMYFGMSDIESTLHDNNLNMTDYVFLKSVLDEIEFAGDIITESYSNILSFIKTFSDKEFDSIYCEREWRSIKNYSFTFDDIAMIILPKEDGAENFYNRFINSELLPRKITIAAWEDIIEH